MERQKILLVILSVSLLLVVVLAGGLYFFRPPAGEDVQEEGGVSSLANVDFDPFMFVQGDKEPLSLEPDEEPLEVEIFVGFDEGESASSPPTAGPKTTSPTAPVRQPTPAVREPAPSPQKAPASEAAPTPAADKPKTVAVEEYWIQAGSYKSRTRAEGFRERLAEAGLTARITTRAVGGEMFFRVRIGPFANKGEADKFLSWIKRIEGLGSSYVSVVYPGN